jgi:hypothetical protein
VEAEVETEEQELTQQQLLEVEELEVESKEESEDRVKFQDLQMEFKDLRQQLEQLEDDMDMAPEEEQQMLFEERQGQVQKLQQVERQMLPFKEKYQWAVDEEEVEEMEEEEYNYTDLQRARQEQLVQGQHSPLVPPRSSAPTPGTYTNAVWSMNNTGASAVGARVRASAGAGARARANASAPTGSSASASASAAAGTSTSASAGTTDFSPAQERYSFPEEWHHPCTLENVKRLEKFKWMDLKTVCGFGYIHGLGLTSFLHLRPDVHKALKDKQIRNSDVRNQGIKGVHVFHTEAEACKYFRHHLELSH